MGHEGKLVASISKEESNVKADSHVRSIDTYGILWKVSRGWAHKAVYYWKVRIKAKAFLGKVRARIRRWWLWRWMLLLRVKWPRCAFSYDLWCIIHYKPSAHDSCHYCLLRQIKVQILFRCSLCHLLDYMDRRRNFFLSMVRVHSHNKGWALSSKDRRDGLVILYANPSSYSCPTRLQLLPSGQVLHVVDAREGYAWYIDLEDDKGKLREKDLGQTER